MNTKSTDIGLLVARLGLGSIMLFYGLQKTLGLFNGNGFGPTMESFTTNMGIPAPFAFLAIIAESFGALGLAVGLLTRVAAIGTLSTMAVATVFSLNRVGGLEAVLQGEIPTVNQVFYPLALFFGYLALFFTGPGRYSLDHLLGVENKFATLFNRKKAPEASA